MNRWTRKTLHSVLVIAAALLLQVMPAAVRAAAPPELSGVWQGKLAIDASNSLSVQFTFTKGSNGAYTAVLNSPDNPALKDTATTGVSFDGTNLKLQVPTLSGSFAGTLKDGKVTGQWTQPGGNLPLVLAPFQKPVVTAAAAKSITGAWNGPLTMGAGMQQNVVFTFKQGDGGGLEGTLSIPDQGATLKMVNVLFENGNLTLKIQQGQALFDFAGKVAGDQITGKLKVPSPQAPPDGIPLTLKRGEYKVVVPPLKLNAESYARVSGKWQGSLELSNAQTGAKQTIRLILRIETNAKGEYVAFVDSPDQNANGLVVSEATLTGDKFELKLPVIGGQFSGTLAGKTLTGDWEQPARNFKQALTLTRQ